MDYQQIAALLSGSIGTLIIKSGIDYFGKRTEHNRLLEKITFEKKLEVGESAIAFYSYYKYNVIQMQKNLEVLCIFGDKISNGEEVDFDSDGFEKKLNSVGLIITELFSSKYQDVLKMNLYYEFPDEDNSGDNLLTFFTALGEVRGMSNSIEFWIKESNKAQNSNDNLSQQYWNEVLSLFPNYVKGIREVIRLIKIDIIGSDKVIKSIKSQIKIR